MQRAQQRIENGLQGLRAFAEHPLHALAVNRQFTDLPRPAGAKILSRRLLAAARTSRLRPDDTLGEGMIRDFPWSSSARRVVAGELGSKRSEFPGG